MIRVLCVDHHDAARAPMFKAMLTGLLWAKGLRGEVSVESAGTSADPESGPADLPAVLEMEERGLSLHRHRSRRLPPDEQLRDFDYILCADEATFQAVKCYLPREAKANLEFFSGRMVSIAPPTRYTTADCAAQMEPMAREWVSEFDALVLLAKAGHLTIVARQ